MKKYKRISWKTFQEDGMLWFVNRILHLFGLAIVMELHEDGGILDVYPATCSYRGFSELDESDGFQLVTRFLSKNVKRLMREESRVNPGAKIKPTKKKGEK